MTHGLTKTEVAALLGIDRSRVWQIEQRALKKLRLALEGVDLETDPAVCRVLRTARREFEDRAES